MNKDKLIGYLSALGYALIIGFSFLFSKDAMKYGVINQLAYRSILAFIPLGIAAIFMRNKLNYNKSKLGKLMGLGIFYPLLFFGIQTYGLSITSSLEAGLAQAMAPVITLILASVLLNEKTNILQKLSLAISIGGIVFIIYRKLKLNPNPDITGLAILFLATVAFSIYSVAVRKIRNENTNFEIMLVIIAQSAFIFTALAIYESISSSGGLSKFINPLSDIDYIKDILYLGLLSSLLSGLLLNTALIRIEASKVVIFGNLATVIQIFSAGLILGEDIFFSHKVGSICIILGVIGINVLGTKEKSRPQIE